MVDLGMMNQRPDSSDREAPVPPGGAHRRSSRASSPGCAWIAWCGTYAATTASARTPSAPDARRWSRRPGPAWATRAIDRPSKPNTSGSPSSSGHSARKTLEPGGKRCRARSDHAGVLRRGSLSPAATGSARTRPPAIGWSPRPTSRELWPADQPQAGLRVPRLNRLIQRHRPLERVVGLAREAEPHRTGLGRTLRAGPGPRTRRAGGSGRTARSGGPR